MSKRSGIGSAFYVGTKDVSGDIGALTSISQSRALQDVSSIQSDGTERIPLRSDGSIAYAAFWNPAAGQGVATLKTMTNDHVLVTYADGTSLGSYAASMWAHIVNFNAVRGEDGSIGLTGEAMASRGERLEWGQLLTVGTQTVASAEAVAAWVVNTVYVLNSLVRPTTPNGHYYKATVAGTSHPTVEPTFPTNGSSVTEILTAGENEIDVVTEGAAATGTYTLQVDSDNQTATSVGPITAPASISDVQDAFDAADVSCTVTNAAGDFQVEFTGADGGMPVALTVADDSTDGAVAVTQSNAGVVEIDGPTWHDEGILFGGIDRGVGSASDFGLAAYLHVFSIGSGSADVKLQDSGDRVTWDDVTDAAFTAVTEPGTERIQTGPTENIRRYVRVLVSGTFTNLVAVVNAVVYPNAQP